MADSVMKKLDYTNAPDINNYRNDNCRQYLRFVSSYSCTYCTISESEAPGATFHVEHFRPKVKFPQFENTASNLRYACPRCNSIKSDHWIGSADGCIRNCKKCDTKGCHKNIFRLIDSVTEDPCEHLVLLDDNILEVINGSKPATHTIKYLRLNRAQLVKLRYTRRYLQLWKQELEKMKVNAEKKIVFVNNKRIKFETIQKPDGQYESNEKKQLIEIIDLLLDILLEQAEHSKRFIDNELEKVNKLIGIRSGPDDVIL